MKKYLPLAASASSAVFLPLVRLRPLLLRDSFRLVLSPLHDFPGILDFLFQCCALNVSALFPHDRPAVEQGSGHSDGVEP